jgi:hypothetical protein
MGDKTDRHAPAIPKGRRRPGRSTGEENAMKTLHKLFVACFLVGWACAAAAQSYPNRTVRFIVPYPAGGYYDLLARVIGQKLTENWGQSVVVENRVGANGMLGTDFVAKSPPDGYTILMGGIGPFGISPSLYPKMMYDPVRDFAPVIHVASSPNVLVVHPSVEARSVKELIALARSSPGKLTFSSAGIGSSQHLSGEMFGAKRALGDRRARGGGFAAVRHHARRRGARPRRHAARTRGDERAANSRPSRPADGERSGRGRLRGRPLVRRVRACSGLR